MTGIRVSQMKLLRVIGTLDPSYGGPVEAFLQLNGSLGSMGHTVEAVTLDGTDAPWLSGFPGIVHSLGPSLGNYRYNKRLVPWLKARSGDFDAVLVDGIWQFQSFGTWLAARDNSIPYFVFIHGALDPWFKKAYPLKHLKKYLYWPWAEYRVLRDARGVFFTSEDERILARGSFFPYRVKETVAELGIRKPDGDPQRLREMFLQGYPSLREKRLILFLGRIHPKKGCDLLIEAFAKTATEETAIHLVVAGPDRDGWQRNLMDLSVKYGMADRITWTGMLSGEMKWGAFHASEVFVLPSHSENFGIAVTEALACGVPVLVTDKVNLWREIVQDGAGFAEPDTLVGTVSLIRRWLALSDDEIRLMKSRARVCFESRFEIGKAAMKLAGIIEQRLNSAGDRGRHSRCLV